MCSHLAACLADVEIGSIGVGGDNHFTGSIDDAIVRVGDNVVEELVDGQRSGFSGGCFFGANRVDGDQELVVNGATVKEKSTKDALDAPYAGLFEWRAGVGFSSVLDFGAGSDFGVLVR